MNDITTEEVRSIVREENKYIEKTMGRLANSVEKMVTAVNESAVQSKVTEEKFTRVHEQINENRELAIMNNKSIVSITTDILPEIEATIAVNSFSAKILWKIGFAITLPLLGSSWVMFKVFSNVQTGQTKIMAEAISNLGKALGTP